MLECVWCKQKMGQEWSKDRESLCSGCADKYRFGFAQKMIDGKVAELSKEQRREISARLHHWERFAGAMRSVERETLTGRAEVFSRISAWTCGIIAVALSFVFIELFAVVFVGKMGEIAMSIIAMVVVYGFLFLAVFLHRRVIRFLKFRQLKRKVAGVSYGGI